MSTEKKSANKKTAKDLDFEKLNENEEGKLTGGFSDATEVQSADDGGIILNMSKCNCPYTPTTN
ncbi:hypothetical protein SAMN05518672_11620 [Chitinophaga sp. CF118]|uniref:hypothetical protein n=1 Tax=Chitinophaga sp. CF118 TaxID=1884367 RepID=UPI0008E05281|nr:hypothetical protein [Chitinophaga sp. CF118]SFF09589.1 hypothetical protein SAMN05518672_11620 [Chitinophaga sp. CF118]